MSKQEDTKFCAGVATQKGQMPMMKRWRPGSGMIGKETRMRMSEGQKRRQAKKREEAVEARNERKGTPTNEGG